MDGVLKNLWLMAVLLTYGLADSAHAFTTPAWLYSIEVPIVDQSAQERERAAKEGLLGVLTRITGLPSIPQTQNIQRALNNAARYYDEFVFVADERTGVPVGLRISYQPSAIIKLVKQARLPIWWTRRPQVMAWVVVDEEGERTLLDAESDHPVAEALLKAAYAAGVNLELPVIDAEAIMVLDAEDVWRRSQEKIALATEQYQADINLVGRVRNGLSLDGRALRGDWTYWLDEQMRDVKFNTDDFDTAVAPGVARLATELRDTYSIAAGDPHHWEVEIGGLTGAAPYAELMDYLDEFDFIDQVSLYALQGDVASLVLVTSAGSDQLLRLLSVEDRLAEDTMHLGTGMRLLWRG